MNVTLCDVCKKEILRHDNLVRVMNWSIFKEGEYCEKCWTDKKNWPKIHQKRKTVHSDLD